MPLPEKTVAGIQINFTEVSTRRIAKIVVIKVIIKIKHAA
jgi:hypothetical protein